MGRDGRENENGDGGKTAKLHGKSSKKRRKADATPQACVARKSSALPSL
jgi:hypothetical protein